MFANKLISHLRIPQKVKTVLMRNLRHTTFTGRRNYWQIFKSALVYLQSRTPTFQKKFVLFALKMKIFLRSHDI